jgi:acyl-CoA dehydrogenase
MKAERNLVTEGLDQSLGAWELPPELVMLRDTVRRFMNEEIKPEEDKVPHNAYKLPPDVLSRLQAKAKAIGLWCMQSPVEYGGAGLPLLAQAIVAEEAAKCRMGLYIGACGAFGFDPPLVIFDSTRQHIEKYGIPAVKRGGKTFVAITEPSGGADPARAIRTKAVKQGDRYVLNGQKIFISGANEAPWGLCFARTGEGGSGGISCFIIETDKPGFDAQPFNVIRSWSPCVVTFTDYEVPEENLVGIENRGFDLCQKWLVHARVPYAAATIGVAQAALDMAVEWSKQRKTFGSTLADKQNIQWMLADSEIELRAARLLIYQSAWNGQLGRDIKIDASVAKVYATEAAGRIVDRCIQIFGGLGVSAELPLERWYRELRIRRIGEGPSEVHRMVLARSMLSGRPRN